jgi:hypothetical protein
MTQLLLLWVPISDVILGFPDLRRCKLSHVVSSAFCLKLVSFLPGTTDGGPSMKQVEAVSLLT